MNGLRRLLSACSCPCGMCAVGMCGKCYHRPHVTGGA